MSLVKEGGKDKSFIKAVRGVPRKRDSNIDFYRGKSNMNQKKRVSGGEGSILIKDILCCKDRGIKRDPTQNGGRFKRKNF